ncbi:MAG: NTP transferase domain-containing protein [Acidobacteria bacterium]|nr:NTP transferase domain-containing protein [Acidobacteriota bacterium]
MTKAVILAAGRGTRMQGLTEEVPKPMLLIRGRPLLGHLVENLRTAGLDQILVVTGYRAGQVEAYFAGQAGVVFRRQEVRDGTARAALLAQDFVGADSFLLTYGDILVSPEAYQGIAAKLADCEAVLAVKYVDDPWRGAAVYVEGERVTRIIEKPPRGASTTHWNSAGFYAFRPSIFEHLAAAPLSPRGEYEITDGIRLLLASEAPVGYYAIPGWWRDVGRPEDLEAAEEHFRAESPHFVLDTKPKKY